MKTRSSNYDKSKLINQEDEEPGEKPAEIVFDYAESLRLLARLKKQIKDGKGSK